MENKHYGDATVGKTSNVLKEKSFDFMEFPSFNKRPESKSETLLTRRSTKVASEASGFSEGDNSVSSPSLAPSRSDSRASLISYALPWPKINRKLLALALAVLLVGILLLACIIWFSVTESRDECDSVPCKFGATCIDQWNGFSCNCASGYGGGLCDVDINECDSHPCMNNGTCMDMSGEFVCTCSNGYTGIQCQEEIDECYSNPCGHSSTCLDIHDGYNCVCAPGFTGTHCAVQINECLSNPCANGTCIDKTDGYMCYCDAGFTGKLCDENIDECTSNPCSKNATCIDDVDGFLCSCVDGVYGELCQYRYSELHECCSDPCQNNATCAQTHGGYRCHCGPGWEGLHCDLDVDECWSNPCQNNATCLDGRNEFSCNCEPGYGGILCQTEIDECWSNPCHNLGTCTDDLDGYNCQCHVGHTGRQCETAMDECSSSPCGNHGTCENLSSSFLCFCEHGYTGLQCQDEINECDSNPCIHGTCLDAVNEFECDCPSGYYGVFCQYLYSEVYDCCSSPCQNGGTCEEQVGGYVCNCPGGATGVHCENIPAPDDIIFYVDTSGSMDSIKYNKIDPFCMEILDNLYIAEDSTRVAIVEYGGTRGETKLWDLEDPRSWHKDYIMSGILSLLYDGGGRDMYLGFELCHEILTPDPRPSVPNHVIYISDGDHEDTHADKVIQDLESISTILIVAEPQDWVAHGHTLTQFNSNPDHRFYYNMTQDVLNVIFN